MRVWDKVWRDDRGRIIIWQNPNPPLYIWAGATILAKLIQNGVLHNLFEATAFIALLVWSLLEILRGVNIFRRVLGAVVLIVSLLARMN